MGRIIAKVVGDYRPGEGHGTGRSCPSFRQGSRVNELVARKIIKLFQSRASS
jgi:hypothetical protein